MMLTPVEERRAAIATVMRAVEEHKQRLKTFLRSGVADRGQPGMEVVHLRNQDFRGYLYDLWAEFLELDTSEQIRHLDEERFSGMHWQSLLQSSPYVYHPKWRDHV